MMAEERNYPKRGNHFAHKVVRLMIRVCAAQEIGSDAFALITIVAHTEDAKRYTAPVTWWNNQLQSVLGFTWGKLDRARKRAVAAQWLHYEPGGKGKVGKYWVTVPKEFEHLPDGAVDEDFPFILPTHKETTGEDSKLSSPLAEKEPRDNRGTTEGQVRIFPSLSSSLSFPFSLSATGDHLDLKEVEKEFVQNWNATNGVCKNRGRKLTPQRQQAFRTRMKDHEWRESLAAALDKFPLKVSEDGGWKPDMDWILKPDSVTKILEGKYDWSRSGEKSYGPQNPHEAVDEPMKEY